MEVGSNALVEFWSGRGVHVTVSVSFALQVTLLLLADIRRRTDWSVLKVIIWSAYMLADTAAIYALGHLSVVVTVSEHRLMVLWAPLLLVHLGGQDNITAYAIEDNQLWLRHLQAFGVQVFAAGYVLYASSVLLQPSLLRSAAILIYVVGLLKYGERLWALIAANNSCASSSLSITSYMDFGAQQAVGFPADHNQAGFIEDECDELVLAYSLLDIPKKMFEGPTAYVKIQNETSYDRDFMLKVVELQLTMMYDLLYTKAAVMHTRYGFVVRLISLPFTVAALQLFNAMRAEDDYRRADVIVTKVLLTGAVFLEAISVLRVIFSIWTAALLYERKWYSLGKVAHVTEGVITILLSTIVRSNEAYWSAHMRQHSLFKVSHHTNHRRGSRIAKKMGLEDLWDSTFYSWSTSVPEDIIRKVLVLVSTTEARQVVPTEARQVVPTEARNSTYYTWTTLDRGTRARQGVLSDGAGTEARQGVRSNGAGTEARRGVLSDGAGTEARQGVRSNGAGTEARRGVWSNGAGTEARQGVRSNGTGTEARQGVGTGAEARLGVPPDRTGTEAGQGGQSNGTGTEAMQIGMAKSRGQDAVKRHNLSLGKDLALAWSVELELDESILVWHIATHVYLQELSTNVIGQQRYILERNHMLKRVEAIEALCNYMFYLLVARPYMLPYPVTRQKYVQLCHDSNTHLKTRDDAKDLLSAILEQEKPLLGGSPIKPNSDGDIIGVSQSSKTAETAVNNTGVRRTPMPAFKNTGVRRTPMPAFKNIGVGGTAQPAVNNTRIGGNAQPPVNNTGVGGTGVSQSQETSDEVIGVSRPPVNNTWFGVFKKKVTTNCSWFGGTVQPPVNNTTGGETAQPSINSTLDKGCKLAAQLVNTTQRDDVDAVRFLEMVFEVWVEMLCYTAYNCDEKSHAKNLTNGGELMTIVALMMVYKSNGFIKTENSGATAGTSSSS
ncbi:uncharacterized protein LOC125531556 [Triticum urartu]|uniref:uncharacterized protein LOC125531556 n=1 Tax=Triticum urartu TaxID=4572 RepID=UPI002044157C|nr:uncharacterized protein LOC125531556 [Triticum urartu]